MAEPSPYIYDIDEVPPVRYALLYGLQWAIIIFPSLIILATISGRALHLSTQQQVNFLQLVLLTTGFFTAVQTLWGHRYPLLDGPSTALLLTFVVLAPYGIATIQAGTIFGGVLLIAVVLSGQLRRIVTYATPNVVGVILMLIAFSLMPYLLRSMIGVNSMRPHGDWRVFLLSFGLVLVMAALSHWLRGVWKTVALLLGMLLGSGLFAALGDIHWQSVLAARWVSAPHHWLPGVPHIYWPALLAFAAAYLALLVNSLGSLHGIANVTHSERLEESIPRGIFVNGVAGIVCGLLGVIGNVSYSFSPGVVLANRVASRFVVTYCGMILVLTAFVPKLAALLALVPAPVVGATLCVAMGAQIGAGLALVSRGGELSSRDYFVVGVPVLLGTLVGVLPQPLVASMPRVFHVFLSNGLIVGIFLVLFLEHLLLRKKAA